MGREGKVNCYPPIPRQKAGEEGKKGNLFSLIRKPNRQEKGWVDKKVGRNTFSSNWRPCVGPKGGEKKATLIERPGNRGRGSLERRLLEVFSWGGQYVTDGPYATVGVASRD